MEKAKKYRLRVYDAKEKISYKRGLNGNLYHQRKNLVRYEILDEIDLAVAEGEAWQLFLVEQDELLPMERGSRAQIKPEAFGLDTIAEPENHNESIFSELKDWVMKYVVHCCDHKREMEITHIEKFDPATGNWDLSHFSQAFPAEVKTVKVSEEFISSKGIAFEELDEVFFNDTEEA